MVGDSKWGLPVSFLAAAAAACCLLLLLLLQGPHRWMMSLACRKQRPRAMSTAICLPRLLHASSSRVDMAVRRLPACKNDGCNQQGDGCRHVDVRVAAQHSDSCACTASQLPCNPQNPPSKTNYSPPEVQ